MKNTLVLFNFIKTFEDMYKTYSILLFEKIDCREIKLNLNLKKKYFCRLFFRLKPGNLTLGKSEQ